MGEEDPHFTITHESKRSPLISHQSVVAICLLTFLILFAGNPDLMDAIIIRVQGE